MQEAGLLVVIVLLGLGLTVFGGNVKVGGHVVNNFFRSEYLMGVSSDFARYAIMAFGVSFVIIAGGIDISIGAIYALAALGAAAAIQIGADSADPGLLRTLGLATVVACGIGLLCGLINGACVVWLRMHPFIVTLGTMSIFRGIGNVAVKIKTLPQAPDKVLPESFTNFFMYQARPYVQPVPLIITFGCLIASWFYLSLMVAGRENYAIGGNEEAARFSGLKVGAIKLRVFMLSGLGAGIAGLVSCGFSGAANTGMGQGYELTVIAAAVVGGASLAGGRGTALGALLGALVIKLIENGIFILKLNQEYSSIIIGIAIIVAVAVDRLSEYFSRESAVGWCPEVGATACVAHSFGNTAARQDLDPTNTAGEIMKRALGMFAVVLMVASSLSAADRKKITIGLVAKSQSNAVFQAAYAGAKDAAKELADKYDADVTIDWQTPADEDAQKQAEAIDNLARGGAQGIAISCSEANTVTPAINRAVAAGSVVMCFDSDAPRSKRMCYYGTEDMKACTGQRALMAGNRQGDGRQGDDRDPGWQSECAKLAGPRERRARGTEEASGDERVERRQRRFLSRRNA